MTSTAGMHMDLIHAVFELPAVDDDMIRTGIAWKTGSNDTESCTVFWRLVRIYAQALQKIPTQKTHPTLMVEPRKLLKWAVANGVDSETYERGRAHLVRGSLSHLHGHISLSSSCNDHRVRLETFWEYVVNHHDLFDVDALLAEHPRGYFSQLLRVMYREHTDDTLAVSVPHALLSGSNAIARMVQAMRRARPSPAFATRLADASRYRAHISKKSYALVRSFAYPWSPVNHEQYRDYTPTLLSILLSIQHYAADAVGAMPYDSNAIVWHLLPNVVALLDASK